VGCGGAAKFSNGKYTLTSDGVPRDFWVLLPSGYKNDKAYPLIVGLHWRGASATDVYYGNTWASGKPFYGLKELYGESAIFVAPLGLDAGWANWNDTDIRFIGAMVNQLRQGLCTDTSRTFATGFSYGGGMSNAIGCQMGDVFRAVAPMSGFPMGCPPSPNKTAVILFHAQEDAVVAYHFGEEVRNNFIAKNNCTQATNRIGANGCVIYEGCSDNKPVAWCGYSPGGHWPPGFAAQEIKSFFDRF
jgi:poly(3-hydroxybutyrate) depolymerase